MNLIGKSVVVYGAGKSGLAAYGLAREKGASVTVYDDDPHAARATNSIGVFKDADIIILSPGVSGDKDFILDARLEGKTVVSELEFASDICLAEQIMVTGTNGKTTTTMLIDAILKRAGINSYAVGNIGTPFSSIADKLDATETAVVEASSFQLESSPNISPDIAVILNIAPDHLERHGSMEKYVAAKANIFLRQSSQDIIVYNDDDDEIRALVPQMNAEKVPFSLTHPVKGGAYISSDFVCFDARPVVHIDDIDMRGRELENVLAATAVAAVKGISPFTIGSAVTEFSRPAFRRQYVGSKDGISVFNDSKATNVSSCISACESLEGGIALILGGALREEDFDALFSKLSDKVKAVCVCGENADEILRAASRAGYEGISRFDTISAALDGAMRRARELGLENVLFSPASKSFDLFDNYIERGKFFDGVCRTLGIRK